MEYNDRKERNEAIAAGECALRSLRAAQADLNSARGWGIYDILGGGFISTAIKHSKLNNANAHIEQAKWDLQRFSHELNDVSGFTNNIGVTDFAMFADYFFDGMIADFYVQSKINNARQQVEEAINRVENIIRSLR